MKKNNWLSGLVIALILCISVLLVVVTRINNVRSNLAQISPGAFNYLLQSNRNLSSYIDALRDLTDSRKGNSEDLKATRLYRQKYDVVWGGFSVFKVDFSFQTDQQTQVTELLSSANQYLIENEPLMAADYSLSVEEIDKLIAGARVITEKIANVGHQYFIHAGTVSDRWNEEVNRLYRLFWVCVLLMLLAGSLLIGLLLRSNKGSAELVEKSHKTQREMKRLIDELRSGKLERKAKDSFIAAASHDLRQPLHALGLFLGATEKHVDSEAGRKALGEAKLCAEELNKLFNSLLDLSRLDAGVVEVNKSEFKLNRLLQLMKHEFSVMAQQRGIDFGVSKALYYVNTDALLLNRVLRNLLENAFNHSGATEIYVSVEEKGDVIRLTVADNGVGIPQDEQSDVFSEYYQLEKPERDRSKGLGLGLSIVKRLCEILELEINLESNAHSGTMFHLDLPVGQYREQSEPEPSRVFVGDNSTLAGSLVAVIDDDASIRRSMVSVLESLDFDVVAAESANSMIIELKSRALTPDVIVADYRLRENQTGDVAIHRVRSAFGSQIPAMIITGDTTPGRVSEAASSGFELMHKPVDSATLMRSISRLLSSSTA